MQTGSCDGSAEANENYRSTELWFTLDGTMRSVRLRHPVRYHPVR